MEEFDFKTMFSDIDEETVLIEEAEKAIRASWGVVTQVAGGIYKDSKANGLPEPVAQLVAKEFLIRSINTMRGDA